MPKLQAEHVRAFCNACGRIEVKEWPQAKTQSPTCKRGLGLKWAEEREGGRIKGTTRQIGNSYGCHILSYFNFIFLSHS
jgi:hypothetical protein